MLGIERISAAYGKVYNETTDGQTHDKRSLVLTARHSTSTSWRSDAPIILPGWEYHTRGSRLTSTVPECLYGGRLWMAHLHHHRQHKSPRKTTAHSQHGSGARQIHQECSGRTDRRILDQP